MRHAPLLTGPCPACVSPRDGGDTATLACECHPRECVCVSRSLDLPLVLAMLGDGLRVLEGHLEELVVLADSGHIEHVVVDHVQQEGATVEALTGQVVIDLVL